MAFNVRFQFVGVRVDDDAVINAFRQDTEASVQSDRRHDQEDC